MTKIIVTNQGTVQDYDHVCMHVCMYVCMYRGRPLWNCPWKGAIQLGQGEGPIGIVGPISQPHGTIDTASLTLNHTHALVCDF